MQDEKVEKRTVGNALELAWGLIANAYGGDWDSAPEDWRKAAIRWRDEHWHPFLEGEAMMPKNDGGPAFPSQFYLNSGMTLRQWYAGTIDIPWDRAAELAESANPKGFSFEEVCKARAVLRFVEAQAMLKAEESDE